MQYIKYSNSSGEIVACGTSTTDTIPFPQEDGFTIIEGIGNQFDNYVKNGEIMTYTDAQKEAKIQRPLVPSHWSNETFSWIADT